MAPASHSRPATLALSVGAMESLADHVAVLDRSGAILFVNDAWNTFGIKNGLSLESIGPGVNYLDVCARAALAGEPDAARALEGIAAVCGGHRAAFELEYRGKGAAGERLFLMKATPFRHQGGGAVVSHRDITASTRAARVSRVSRQVVSKLAGGVRLRNLRTYLIAAQEDERRRIGRELHDDVSQRLALLAMGIEHLRNLSQDRTLTTRIRDLWRATVRLSRDVHKLSHKLHTAPSRDVALVPAIRTLARELRAVGLRVTVMADVRCGEVSEALAVCLLRITQEALSNVLTHSGVMEATVTLKGTARSLLLRVEDRGRGFEPGLRRAGLGFLSMRERLTPIRGELWIRARPGEGTRVEVRVPRTADWFGPRLPPTHAA